MCTSMSTATELQAVVGIALKKEKRKKHIGDRLVAQAAEAGIELRFIDKERPLEEQGPFHVILQKVRKPGAPSGVGDCSAPSPPPPPPPPPMPPAEGSPPRSADAAHPPSGPRAAAIGCCVQSGRRP